GGWQILVYSKKVTRRLSLSGRRSALVQDFGQFRLFDFVERFSALFEFLERLDRGFRQALVGFRGAAHDVKAFRLGNALMAVVVIEPQIQQKSLSFLIVSHG